MIIIPQCGQRLAGDLADLEARFRAGLGLIGKPVRLISSDDKSIEGTLADLDFRRVRLEDGRETATATLRRLDPI